MRFVSIDLETTGLNIIQHEMCEFGWANDEETGSFFVNLYHGYTADPVALELNHYYDRRSAKGATDSLNACNTIRRLIDEETFIVCSPAHFDMMFLTKFWQERTTDDVPWGHRKIIDIKSMAVGLNFPWGSKNSSIGDQLEIPDTSDHSAERDAKYQLEIFNKLKGMREPL